MKLYLDDRRFPPQDPEFRSADNYRDFVALLYQYRECIEAVDLDYDLGFACTETGMDVLRHMKKLNISCDHINIHSTHPSGREMMLRYASINFPDSVVTGWESI